MRVCFCANINYLTENGRVIRFNSRNWLEFTRETMSPDYAYLTK